MTAIIMATPSSLHGSSPPLPLLRVRPVTIHQPSTTSFAKRPGVLIQFESSGYDFASLRLLRPQSFSFRIRSRQQDDQDTSDDSEDNKSSSENERIGGKEFSFPAKMAIGLGIATAITLISVGLRWSVLGSSLGIRFVPEGSSMATMASSGHVGFSFNAFGHKIILPEYAPGWIYFWLLMAAGFGLFVSEEALNIWVGISLSRKLCLDGTWRSFSESFSKDTGYVVSTILWVYWGVCISDMVPFYLGKLFRNSRASDDVCSKLGVGKEKASRITEAVQKYGNLIGFVERFSLGVRNPTSFLAGASGISAECYFAGVCCGGLITLPIQLGIGFLMRERPLFSLATVATVVGIWTVFPYALAALTALFLFVRRRYSS